jgi:recombination protein RecA
MIDANKQKAIETAIALIQKQHGKGSIMKMNDDSLKVTCGVISTGSLALNHALGIGGLPEGRIVEIYGPESSGKTTLTLQTIAEAQKMGKVCAFIDAEHALDPIYAQKLGVNVKELIISQPDTGEQALDIVDALSNSSAVDVIVIDSVAALTPKAELEGEMTDANVGLQARMMSKALRKITGTVKKNKILCIFINQIRMKIGVMFGSPETTTGGNALKFYASIRLDIRRTGSTKKGDEVVGNDTKIKVVKNKMAPPFREAKTQIMFGEGMDIYGELIDFAVDQKIVDKAGSWFSYNGDKIGQGKENVKNYLKENTAIFDELYKKVNDNLFGHVEFEELPKEDY